MKILFDWISANPKFITAVITVLVIIIIYITGGGIINRGRIHDDEKIILHEISEINSI